MQTLEMVPIENIRPHPERPRKTLIPATVEAMAASIIASDIKIPLVVYKDGDLRILEDGFTRFEAAKLAKRTHLPCVVLDKAPSEAELLTAQLTIDAHRSSLNPVDLGFAFTSLMEKKGWNATELARQLCISGATVTRALAVVKLSPELQQAVREGRLSSSGAYALTRMDPAERQRVVSKAQSGEVTRDELNTKARRKPREAAPKKARISCPVGLGTVTVSAKEGLDLLGMIELLEELLKECRRARSQGLDIKTAERVLHDRAKASPTTS